ncbi:carbohydrate-binding protein [Ileibacterium valens]|uniref:carbohydrate-binding protein n=1 Tax=Ileibacterium valens TaxID=1862668 RepID=UPI0023523375|nr:carbohydrate-binding protein [Ileibacterium valens]
MKVYVNLSDNFVSALSTFQTDGADIEVVLDQPIDLEKLKGYKVEGKDGINHLVYDAKQFNDWKDQTDKEKTIALEEQLLAQLTRNLALANATDEQAKKLVHQYPEWSGDSVSYKTDDRVGYKDKLYKVLQAHTSQATWTPDVSASLFTVIN